MRVLTLLLLVFFCGGSATAGEKAVLLMELGTFPDEAEAFHSITEETVVYANGEVAKVCTIHTVTVPVARGDGVPLDADGRKKLLYGIAFLSAAKLVSEVDPNTCTMKEEDFLPHPDFVVEKNDAGKMTIVYFE